MVEVNGEVYFLATCAARYIGVARGQFYNNVKPCIHAYKLPARRRLHYKQSDLDMFRLVEVAA